MCPSMQAQWAEAISHENEKLHQLSELQRGIIADLQRHIAPDQAVPRGPAELQGVTQSYHALHTAHPCHANCLVRGRVHLLKDSGVLLYSKQNKRCALALYIVVTLSPFVAGLKRAGGWGGLP